MTSAPKKMLGASLLAGLVLVSGAQAQEPNVEVPVVIQVPPVILPPGAEIGMRHVVVPLSLVVDDEGRVVEAAVLEPLGEVVDLAVLSAARDLRFSPARVDGKATRARIAFEMPLGSRSTDGKSTNSSSSSSLSPAPAEQAPVSPATGEDEKEQEVVVTGARIPERKDRSVIAVEVITRDEIRRTGATTVGEALEAHPSLQINRSFRGTELWIRGLDPEYTLVLIDGERVPGRIGGAIDLSRFPLEMVERVEVVRGPSSALYGSDAIGGVVNIITRTSEALLEADAEARVGTGNAAAASGRVSARPGDQWGASVNGGYVHTPAFRRDEAQTGTTGSARTLNSAGASATLGGDKVQTVRLSADYTRTRLEGVDEGSGGAVFDRTQLQEQSLFSANQQLRFRDTYVQNIAQYSHFRDQYLVDQRGAVALDDYEQNIEHLGQLTTTAAHEWSARQRTTIGFEMLSQILDSPRLFENGYRARYSMFSEHRWVVAKTGARELITVVPGARLDVDSQFGSQLSPKLAVRADPTEEVVLRAGYGRGFRAPSFQELLLRFENQSVGYVVEGNPELGAESSHSADVSAEWRPGPEWFFSGAGFYNYLTDMIGTITAEEGTASGTLFTYDNIDYAWTRGLEGMAIWSPLELLSLTLGYTFMETHDGERDRPLPGRPVHRLVLRTVSQYKPWGVTLSARASASLERIFFEEDASGVERQVVFPLFQADVRLEKEFNDHFSVFAGVNNLADAGDVYTPLLPRQGYAGVSGRY